MDQEALKVEVDALNAKLDFMHESEQKHANYTGAKHKHHLGYLVEHGHVLQKHTTAQGGCEHDHLIAQAQLRQCSISMVL